VNDVIRVAMLESKILQDSESKFWHLKIKIVRVGINHHFK